MENVYIRDERNNIVGYSQTIGNVIHYYSSWFGQVGEYDVSTKRYRRWKNKPGDSGMPWPGTDYGLSDVLYWAAMKR